MVELVGQNPSNPLRSSPLNLAHRAPVHLWPNAQWSLWGGVYLMFVKHCNGVFMISIYIDLCIDLYPSRPLSI
jgi:hypothetical protein